MRGFWCGRILCVEKFHGYVEKNKFRADIAPDCVEKEGEGVDTELAEIRYAEKFGVYVEKSRVCVDIAPDCIEKEGNGVESQTSYRQKDVIIRLYFKKDY
jgi:RNA-binding protein YlmH